MEVKINIPLIDRITGLFSKIETKPKSRQETTETSLSLPAYYYKKMELERTRLGRYADYRLMDEDSVEVYSFLDIYADYATKEKDEGGEAFEISSDDKKVKTIIDEMVHRTRLQDTSWDSARNIVKMGDEFDEVIVDDNNLIVRLKNLQPEMMEEDVDEYGLQKEEPFIQKDPSSNARIASFKPWQIIHWKNAGSKKMYGISLLQPIRKLYKQLSLIEDQMIIGRLTRSHQRFKFLVDVEGMNPDEREDYMRRVKESVKKKRIVNPLTGQMDVTQNPISVEEDFFIEVTKDSKADVGVVQGALNLGNIKDVEYFQNKLFIGLGPRSLLGIEGDADTRASSIEHNINLLRRISRIRKALRTGIKQVGNYQLQLLGIPPAEGLWEVHFSPMSMVDEMRKWTMEKLKAEVAQIYRANIGLLSDEYVLKNYVGVPDDEIAKLLKEPVNQVKKSLSGNGGLDLRTSGLTGALSPGATAMNSKKTSQESYVGNGFHMAAFQLMNLVETMRDLVSLELNR